MQRLIHCWLLLIGAGHVIAGVALPWLTGTSLFTPYLQLLQAHLGEAGDTESAQALLRLLVGLLGPTVGSWGLLYCALIQLYRSHGLRLAKPALYAALLVWCLLDSGLSAHAGLWLNLYLNFGVALAIGIPLAFLQPRGRAA